jgi:hypothetical protein
MPSSARWPSETGGRGETRHRSYALDRSTISGLAKLMTDLA